MSPAKNSSPAKNPKDESAPLSLRWGTATHIGLHRKSNQDAYLADAQLFAVADGMGGHRGGAEASKLALETLQENLQEILQAELDNSKQDVALALREAIHAADRAVLQESLDNPRLAGMGTTLCAMLFWGATHFALANVGDSRIYVLSNDDLQQITTDHTVHAALVSSGKFTPEEAALSLDSEKLTQAIGGHAGGHAGEGLEVDVWEISAQVGDRFLLCSDGLAKQVSDSKIKSTLKRLRSPEKTAEALVKMANDAGGLDNTTIIIVDVVADDTGA